PILKKLKNTHRYGEVATNISENRQGRGTSWNVLSTIGTQTMHKARTAKVRGWLYINLKIRALNNFPGLRSLTPRSGLPVALPLLALFLDFPPGFFAGLHRLLQPRHELRFLSAPGHVLLAVFLEDFLDAVFVHKPADNGLLRERYKVGN